MSFSRWMLSALIVGALLACGPAPAGHTPVAAQTVNVTVDPASAEIRVGGTAQLAATVTGTADTTVAWSVVEAGGGAVDAAGVYSASGGTGVFHVRATSRAAPDVFGEATVSVVAPPAVVVTVSPRTTSVVAGGTVGFTATVANASNVAVTWSVPTAGCGTITAGGQYTAPGTARVCTVVATSVADPSRSDTATVTVTAPPPPVVVTITPSPAAVDACRSLTFTATVTGTANTGVTWSVQEAGGGTITAAGVYTAPANAATYHVVATSVAARASTTVAAVTVSDRIVSVAVSPQTVQVPPGGTAQFTATVTTTCGSTVATQTINSAGQIVAR